MSYDSTIFNKENSSFLTGEILYDESPSGKKRQWANYKKKSIAISNAYYLIEGLERRGSTVASCGCCLKFISCPNKHQKRLVKAYFCRDPLCVMCQWRKSLVIFHQMIQLVHAHKDKRPSDVPLLLTLTIPNVSAQELPNALSLLLNSFKKLMKKATVQRVVQSWFRALEITYNKKRDDFHPHFHVLLMVRRTYFKKSRELYISRDEWLKLWQKVTGIPEITQVDVRKVKKRSKHAAIQSVCAEVAKYATKASDYVNYVPATGDFFAEPKIVAELYQALRRRRLVGYGGLFKQLRKELKQKDVEKADLIQISGEEKPCVCSICSSTLMEEDYYWNVGLRNYIG